MQDGQCIDDFAGHEMAIVSGASLVDTRKAVQHASYVGEEET